MGHFFSCWKIAFGLGFAKMICVGTQTNSVTYYLCDLALGLAEPVLPSVRWADSA